ncbi:hypothetical protein RO3G_08765 [Rhizopus delemar RA 99-880]|uniref:Palmitoyltransferase n=1 Tax=Rhizopus delemar (strain RA 99-880 / ATCC MYA-4621 / FGSC 9543 / NRRL 43880) TaxID=246409 RepID=I1C6I0_RHIO9|nr:hypothetical protein RO3G_08765 [Rhizopus delemar RA 99-880]|eukprot:EIE84060.1 hypothetical protein RO3G_08765 [Rhizopus delemar RA 99-880]
MPRCPSLKKVQRCCMAIVNASPVALLVVLFTWSFWAFNFRLIWNQFINKEHFIQVIYYPSFILCVWSYWTVCKTSPGYTIDLHKKKKSEEPGEEEENDGLLNTHEELSLRYPITVKRDGARRYCQKCKLEKFDRTHHCRQCQKCVLKMDQTTIEFYEKTNFMLGRNDVMRTKYFNPWDVGTRKNIEQVLGKNKWKMFIPVGKPLGEAPSLLYRITITTTTTILS